MQIKVNSNDKVLVFPGVPTKNIETFLFSGKIGEPADDLFNFLYRSAGLLKPTFFTFADFNAYNARGFVINFVHYREDPKSVTFNASAIYDYNYTSTQFRRSEITFTFNDDLHLYTLSKFFNVTASGAEVTASLYGIPGIIQD